MKNIIKNIASILLYIWAMPFQIAILIITIIGGIPIMLFSTKVLFFNRFEKQWKITKFIESISNKLEITNIF